MNDKSYDKRHHDVGPSVAVTVRSERRVDFRESTFALRVCRHELWHMYCATLYTASADLSPDQMEELQAEMLEDYMNKMPEQADYIYERLRNV